VLEGGKISYYGDELSFMKGKKAKGIVTLSVNTRVQAEVDSKFAGTKISNFRY
jgi:hypothetical protein